MCGFVLFLYCFFRPLQSDFKRWDSRLSAKPNFGASLGQFVRVVWRPSTCPRALDQSAAYFLREFRNSLTLDSADREILGGWREFAFRTGDRARSVGRAAARFGVDHSLYGIRHSDDEHPKMNQWDHHRDAGRLLAAVCGSGRGEDASGLALHRAR